MIVQIVAAALIAASPAPGPAPSPAPQSTAPLREVVYKVLTLAHIDDITESFGGGPDASPPASTSEAEANGTVTVDVMAKFEDGVLGTKIVERWKTQPVPLRFTGAVAPDGTVEFAPNTIDTATIELLPYFATRFVPEGAVATGIHWSVEKSDGGITVSTNYVVSSVGADTFTIHKDTTIKSLGSETVTGTIVYDQSRLVAVSGQVRVRRTEMYANGQRTRTVDVRFERVSDTFQTPASP